MLLHKDKKERNKNYKIGLQVKENNPKTKSSNLPSYHQVDLIISRICKTKMKGNRNSNDK